MPLIASLGFFEILLAMLALVWLAGRYANKHAQSAINLLA
jgi:hypothetical protein